MPVPLRLSQNLSPSRRNGPWDSTTDTRRRCGRSAAHACMLHTQRVFTRLYANPISFTKKTADQVVRGLKLKLKTSPTKVRLASLKKI